MTKHSTPTKQTMTSDVELARELLTRHPSRDTIREAAHRLMIVGEQMGETDTIARGTWDWTKPSDSVLLDPPRVERKTSKPAVTLGAEQPTPFEAVGAALYDVATDTVRPMMGAAPSAYDA